MPYWVGLLCSCVLSGFIGFLIAIPALRLRGGYLVIVTIGIAQIFQSSFRNLTWLTRGPMGLPAIPKPDLLFLNFNTLESFLVLAFLFAFLTFFILQRIVKSPYGRVLRAIKEDEIATSAMGKNTWSFKMQVMIIGSIFAGVAGNLYAHYLTYIDPSMFSLKEQTFLLSAIVLGGLGNNIGSVVGVAILTMIPEALRFLGFPYSIVGPLRQLLFSVLLVGIMLFRRKGILGKVE